MEKVAELALALPEVTEGPRWGTRTWFVRKKAFAWDRPFSMADLKRYGDERVPQGEILAVCVADLHDKEALLAGDHPGVFTIPHFDRLAAVLIELGRAPDDFVEAAVTEAWLAQAPPPT